MRPGPHSILSALQQEAGGPGLHGKAWYSCLTMDHERSEEQHFMSCLRVKDAHGPNVKLVEKRFSVLAAVVHDLDNGLILHDGLQRSSDVLFDGRAAVHQIK